MVRKSRGTRKAKSGIISKVLRPFGHLFSATGESAGKLGNGLGDIVKRSVKAFKGVGSSFSRHAGMAVRNLTKRNSKNSRKSSRKNSRKNSRK